MGELPVKRIVFYKHGIGYVERKGKLKADEISLQFKKEDMNDILKSLLVLDENGKVTGVNYESHEDVEKRKKNALVVPEANAVTGLLKALKGYEVSVSAEKELEGRVIGIEMPDGSETKESQLVMVNNNDSEGREPVLSLLDAKGSVHFVDVGKIKSIAIKDEHALGDLGYFLELSASERNNDIKTVTVHLDGDKVHELTATYIMSMPVWRASYRFSVDKDRAFLQGWGMVDNPLEEDLEDVNVSLVAGQPVSFVYDFYAPPASKRPVVAEYAAAVSAPVEIEPKLELPRAEAKMMRKMQARGISGLEFDESETEEFAPMRFDRSVEVKTETKQVGALFRYDITDPVTIKRGQSAMLPILQQKIDGSKVVVYTGERNPVMALRFRNVTGLTLERGPVTIYEDGMYAGEAILPFTPESGEQFIAYAKELGVEISDDTSHSRGFVESSIKGHFLVRSEYEKKKTKYKINNKTKKAVKLLLEHRKAYGHDLLEPKKPDEETETHYRWNVEVPAGKTVEFECVEGKTNEYKEEVDVLTMDSLEKYFKQGQISEDLKARLGKIAEKTDKAFDLEEEKDDLKEELENIHKEQDRLRKNISSLSKNKEGASLVKKYVKQLEEEEDRIQKMHERMAEIDKEVSRIRKEVKEMVKNL